MRNHILFIGLLLSGLGGCREEFPEIIGNKKIDGKNYKTVYYPKLDQTWMAENLVRGNRVQNVELESSATNEVIEYYCYDDIAGNCDDKNIQAAFYSWSEAIQSDALDLSLNSQSIQGVCPENWRIPHREDWLKLFFCLGFNGSLEKKFSAIDSTGEKLKIGDFCTLPNGKYCNTSTFSAVPTGIADLNLNRYIGSNNSTYFWTSTLVDTNIGIRPIYIELIKDSTGVSSHVISHLPAVGYCVRCVRDGKD